MEGTVQKCWNPTYLQVMSDEKDGNPCLLHWNPDAWYKLQFLVGLQGTMKLVEEEQDMWPEYIKLKLTVEDPENNDKVSWSICFSMHAKYVNIARIPHQQTVKTANVSLVAHDQCFGNLSFPVQLEVLLDASKQKLLKNKNHDQH